MNKEYRKNIGIVIFNSEKKVLLCQRADKKKPAWQFPQGGIDDKESTEEAAKRELFEETSITSAKPVHITPQGFYYDFPKHMKHEYKGQYQYWALFYFYGTDDEIDINTKEQEFSDYKWADINIAPQEIVEFKKDIYNKVVNIFEPIINEYQI